MARGHGVVGRTRAVGSVRDLVVTIVPITAALVVTMLLSFCGLFSGLARGWCSGSVARDFEGTSPPEHTG